MNTSKAGTCEIEQMRGYICTRDFHHNGPCALAREDQGPTLTSIMLEAGPTAPQSNHGLDTDDYVFFYEQDFYVLSNFSAFTLVWAGMRFDTSEAAYHFEKFPHSPSLQWEIRTAISAHEAYKIAEAFKIQRRADWDRVKVEIMRRILRAKAGQHEYVRRKLLETGDRVLIENSWRDSFWGWGADKKGENVLGKLWMSIREEIRASSTSS